MCISTFHKKSAFVNEQFSFCYVKGQMSLTMAEWLRLDDNNRSVGIDAVATDKIRRESIRLLLCNVENTTIITWREQNPESS